MTEQLNKFFEETSFSSSFKREFMPLVTSKEMERISFLPTYHVKKADSEVIIHSLLKTNTLFGNVKVRELYMLALNESNEIAGFRASTIRSNHDQSFWLNSTIAVRENLKGKGYGSAIEMAHADILQRLANTWGNSITQIVNNTNLERLNKLEELLSNAEKLSDKEKDDLLREKQEEQKRWRELFGPDGKFGFKESNGQISKEIRPNSNGESEIIDQIDSIVLEKAETKLGELAKVEILPDNQQRKKEFYKATVLPLIEGVYKT